MIGGICSYGAFLASRRLVTSPITVYVGVYIFGSGRKQESWGGGRVCANEFPTKFWFPGCGTTFERALEKFEIFSASNNDIGP